MRSFLTVALMILSVAAFSFEDGRRGPSAEEREQGRACFQEMKALGCGSPREDREAFKKCVAEKSGELSESCQAFHQKMKDHPRHKHGRRAAEAVSQQTNE